MRERRVKKGRDFSRRAVQCLVILMYELSGDRVRREGGGGGGGGFRRWWRFVHFFVRVFFVAREIQKSFLYFVKVYVWLLLCFSVEERRCYILNYTCPSV